MGRLMTVVFVVSLLAIPTGCTQDAEKTTSEPEIGKVKQEIVQKKATRETIGKVEEGWPFSPAVKIDNTLYVSGQIPIDPETGEEVHGDIKEQTAQVMKNVERLVKEAGFDMKDVVRATVFITDMDHFADMNSVYTTYFPSNPPARACVAVKELARGFLVEISCIAQR